jgi:hypothetical protein
LIEQEAIFSQLLDKMMVLKEKVDKILPHSVQSVTHYENMDDALELALNVSHVHQEVFLIAIYFYRIILIGKNLIIKMSRELRNRPDIDYRALHTGRIYSTPPPVSRTGTSKTSSPTNKENTPAPAKLKQSRKRLVIESTPKSSHVVDTIVEHSKAKSPLGLLSDEKLEEISVVEEIPVEGSSFSVFDSIFDHLLEFQWFQFMRPALAAVMASVALLFWIFTEALQWTFSGIQPLFQLTFGGPRRFIMSSFCLLLLSAWVYSPERFMNLVSHRSLPFWSIEGSMNQHVKDLEQALKEIKAEHIAQEKYFQQKMADMKNEMLALQSHLSNANQDQPHLTSLDQLTSKVEALSKGNEYLEKDVSELYAKLARVQVPTVTGSSQETGQLSLVMEDLERQMFELKRKVERIHDSDQSLVKESILKEVKVLLDQVAANHVTGETLVNTVIQLKQEGQEMAKNIATDVVVDNLLLYHADANGKADYALKSGGASVIKSLTSPTYSVPKRKYSPLLNMVFGILRTESRPPETALDPNCQVGHCWAMKGN